MNSLDGSITAVATPRIGSSLHASGAEVQLIFAAYILAFGALVVTGARLGDGFGHRRVFLLGLAGFTLASLACGLAPSIDVLLVARVAQGATAALMTPQTLSLIQLTLTEPRRSRAIGIYTLTLALGTSVGELVGGGVLDLPLRSEAWRLAFLLNVPVGCTLMPLADRRLPATPRRRVTIDVVSVAALAAVTSLWTSAALFGRQEGWPPWSLAAAVAPAPLLVVFHRRQRHVARAGGSPFIDLRLFHMRGISATLLAAALVMGGYGGLLLVLTLHLQDDLQYSPLAAGATCAVYAGGFGTLSLIWPRFRDRVRRALPPLGFALFAVASGYLALAADERWPAPTIFLALFLGGAGHAAAFSPLVARAARAVDRSYAAQLTGVLTTATLLADVAGVALLGGVYLSVGGRTGFVSAMACLSAMLALGGLVARRAVRTYD